jgi:hypothetical protein
MKWVVIAASAVIVGIFLFVIDKVITHEQADSKNEAAVVEKTNANDTKETKNLIETSVEKVTLENEQKAAVSYFEEMINAIEENNKTEFMAYQDETNELFYKEQEVWFHDIVQNEKEGWAVSIAINDVTLELPDKGSISLQIKMQNENQAFSNLITYPINKVNGAWKMNDLPFEIASDGPIRLYYLHSFKNKADGILADVKELVDLYSETFAWDLEEINIKLYDTVEKISASTGWPMLYGVAVPFISNKFVVQGDYEVTYGLMKHEIVHAMLADLTNDNAPHFLQEGLAIFISNSVVRSESGKLQLDFNNTAEREKAILELTEEIKPIASFEDINYTDDSIDIYNVGFLLTNYLIHTYGIEKYLDMVDALKEHDIIDIDDPNKEQIAYKRAIEALEQTYGPLDKLSKEYIDYYNGRK